MNRIVLFAAAAVFVLVPVRALGQSLSPFVGNWTGETHGEIEAGKREKLKCNAYGSMAGNDLNIKVRCAGTATNGAIRISARVQPSAGGVSGTWEEARFGVQGSLRGAVSGNTLNGRIESPNYSASVTIQRVGGSLSISVLPSGDALRITVSMRPAR